MKPLSEQYDAITGQHIINGEIVRKNVTPEVAQLEANRDEYRNLYHLGEAKITSREAIIEQLSESELAKDVTRLEAENEALKGNDDGTEKCLNCGSMVEQVWNAPDELWDTLSEYPQGNGILCTRCFDREAKKQGVFLYWSCQPNQFLHKENEALIDALNHCGYDPDDCIDCGGPPHNEYCRFWKVRHLLSYWEF